MDKDKGQIVRAWDGYTAVRVKPKPRVVAKAKHRHRATEESEEGRNGMVRMKEKTSSVAVIQIPTVLCVLCVSVAYFLEAGETRR